MDRLPRITEILKVEPFKVTCRWTTGEIRVVDFEELMTRWQVDKSAVEAPLRNYETFRFVSVGEGRTLQWVNVPVRHRAFDETGRASETESPLAFDPDVLYAESVSLEEFRLARISTKAAA
ncbi:MAG: hypothetical protein H7Y12_15155 [Sphingobacteriaceae bacterium]|nr:hypothetical protein [Cytophagaceae bacterium]